MPKIVERLLRGKNPKYALLNKQEILKGEKLTQKGESMTNRATKK
jgi:hypothetical protein